MDFDHPQQILKPLKTQNNETLSKLQDHSITRKFKDSTAAFASGVSQVLIGQPLDLIKVLIQTGKYQNSAQAISLVFRNEGLLAFYKGSMVPLVGVGLINTIMFNFCYESRRLVYERQKKELSMSEYYITGSIAGLLTSFITSPVEQIRIMLQTNKFKTTRDCFNHLFHDYGFRKGLYNGLGLTALRDAHSHGIWFLSFEYMMNQKQKISNVTRDQISTLEILIFGGIAGDLLWITTYPIDVIKTIKQSNIGMKTSTIIESIYQQHGLKGFWTGIGPTLIRAVPVNAGVFATVELCLRVLG